MHSAILWMPVQMISLFKCFMVISPVIPNNNTLSMFCYLFIKFLFKLLLTGLIILNKMYHGKPWEFLLLQETKENSGEISGNGISLGKLLNLIGLYTLVWETENVCWKCKHGNLVEIPMQPCTSFSLLGVFSLLCQDHAESTCWLLFPNSR